MATEGGDGMVLIGAMQCREENRLSDEHSLYDNLFLLRISKKREEKRCKPAGY